MRGLLNRARWGEHAGLSGLTLAVRERHGNREEIRRLSFSEVAEILATGVLTADGTFFPYHRVISLTSACGLVWQAREGKGHGET